MRNRSIHGRGSNSSVGLGLADYYGAIWDHAHGSR